MQISDLANLIQVARVGAAHINETGDNMVAVWQSITMAEGEVKAAQLEAEKAAMAAEETKE